MIVGVAQLVRNVADLDAAAAPLLAAGHAETFRATGLTNHEHKRPLQSGPRASLDMAHFTPAVGVAVELTAYAGGPPAGATVLRRPAPEGDVVVAAADPERSRAFWEALGFRDAGAGRLEVRAALPAWRLGVVLEPAAAPAEATTVDADGWVLVTVLTTGLDAELQRLSATGLLLRSTAAWSEQVADRTPRVAIVEGPSGELVELLEAPRGGSR